MKEKHISIELKKKVALIKRTNSDLVNLKEKYNELVEHSTEQQTHIQHQYALIESLHETLKEINASLKILCPTDIKR